jgi:DNA polymerase III subunit delta
MYRTLAREIMKGHIEPVYLFYGKEGFLIEEMVHLLRKHVLPSEDPSFHEVILDLEEIPVQQLVQEAETPSFFGGRRLVIGKNAWFLTALKGKDNVEHQPEELLRYTENPLESNVVVLIVPAEKLDTRKKTVKALEKNCCTVAFPSLEEKELPGWVAKRLKQAGAAAQPEAVRRLIQLTGNDLRMLDQECRKLAAYAGKEEITPEMVEQLVPRTLEHDVFKLVDCVARQKTDEALSILYDLLYQREEPIRILALLIRQYRIMLQVKVLVQQGKSERQIASALGLHPYPVKLAVRQGEAYSEKTLRSLLLKAIETDQAVKSGKIDKVLALERFLMAQTPEPV